MKTVAMLGEGAWGSAVATVLADNGYRVNLWCYNADTAQEIATRRRNSRYLSGVEFHSSIIPSTSLEVVYKNTDLVFVAIPVQYLRSVLIASKQFINNHRFVILCKGIEQETLLSPTQMVHELIKGSQTNIAVVAGPSFAREVAEKQLTGIVIASDTVALAKEVQTVLENEYVRTTLSDDMIGVQICSALKNVAALGTGMLKGAGYAENTRAFFVTRFLHEIAGLVAHYGGSLETVNGLAGIGDLMLTAYGTQSRNFQVGKRLGSGETLHKILQETGYIPEGVNTATSVYEVSKKTRLQLSLCTAVYHVANNPKGGIDPVIKLLR